MGSTGLSKYAKRALKKLEANKERKTATLDVPSWGEVKIQNITRAELIDIMEMSEEQGTEASENFALYISVIEPNLKELAKELKDSGEINEYTEVCDIFEIYEKTEISQEISKLSGITPQDGKRVTIIEELKKQ